MRYEMKRLQSETTVKEDLQVVYEAIQELGYTEYTLLKLLERLSSHVEEIRSVTSTRPQMQCPSGSAMTDHLFATMELSARTKGIEAELEASNQEISEVQEKVNEISDQIEQVLKELKENLDQGHSAPRDLILKSAPVLIQASKHILQQAGYDPETGNKISNEMNDDYRKLKGRVADFLWSLLFTGIATLIMWSFSNHQKETQREQTQAIEQATKKLLEAAGKKVE